MTKITIFKQGKECWTWKLKDECLIAVYGRKFKTSEEALNNFKDYAKLCKLENYEIEVRKTGDYYGTKENNV